MPPLTLAVLSNPDSGRNRKHGLQAVEAVCSGHNIPHYRVKGPEDIARALQALLPTLPNVLAINSGDGTVNLVIAALRQLAPKWEPILALIRGGSTNMIHRDAGLRGKPAVAMRRLLRNCQAGRLQTVMRSPLLISAIDDSSQPRYGFFLATGAIPRITAAVRQGLHRRGLFGRGSELVTLLSSLWKLWCRRALPHDDMLAPQALAWEADGIAHQDRLIFFATTSLQQLLFRIRTQADNRRFGIMVMNAERRIVHASAAALSFTATADWVIDGEPQPPGTYHVRLDRPLRMLSDA